MFRTLAREWVNTRPNAIPPLGAKQSKCPFSSTASQGVTSAHLPKFLWVCSCCWWSGRCSYHDSNTFDLAIHKQRWRKACIWSVIAFTSDFWWCVERTIYSNEIQEWCIWHSRKPKFIEAQQWKSKKAHVLMFATFLDQMDGVGGVAALVMNVKNGKRWNLMTLSHFKNSWVNGCCI